MLPTMLSRDTLFPSARALLEAGISCREPGGHGWAVYWMEGGSELTLFPGDEGPQEAGSIDEVIEWIGGDQPAVLTPASLRRFGVEDERKRPGKGLLQAAPATINKVEVRKIEPVREESWRRLEGERQMIRCQTVGCERASVWCYTWRTPQMPASSYFYFCDEHVPTCGGDA